MPIKKQDNDHNIERVYSNMSESFPEPNNVKLANCERVNLENYFNTFNPSDIKDVLNLSYDHMYTSNTEITDLNTTDSNCQNAESEVKFLKEWLILHLDLIQQQNDEILDKESAILILKQENEMLKERLNCIERGIPFKPKSFINNQDSTENSLEVTFEDMTQDSARVDEEKDNVHLLNMPSEELNNCLELVNYDMQRQITNRENVSNSFSETLNTSLICHDGRIHVKKEVMLNDKPHEDLQSNKECVHHSNFKVTNSSFALNTSYDDTLKSLRMNIRRKRLCSSSSAFSSNNDSITEDGTIGKSNKKSKRCLKGDKIMTCNEHYVTQTGELAVGIFNDPDIPNPMASPSLEVPRWRVKVYTSCYSMEGTENLDDEVYNRRHMRLENDERRRKRWDVQRIREQRLVEKLKQRQERIGSGSRSDEQADSVHSLWPVLDDVKYLEVSDQLPVSAFGALLPKCNSVEFVLPWFNNLQNINSKTSTRKSTGRRKTAKR